MTNFHITPSQVKEALALRTLKPFYIRICYKCDRPIGYVFEVAKIAFYDPTRLGYEPEDIAIGFDPSCACSGPSSIQPRGYADLAEYFNRTGSFEWNRFIAEGRPSKTHLKLENNEEP
jgi:hypothetical protein